MNILPIHFNHMYKQYNRLQSIPLPIHSAGRKDYLKTLLVLRHSYRNVSGKPVSLKQLSELLFYSAGLVHQGEAGKTEDRRPYPFAGETSTLEMYLWVRRGSDIKKGIYHYCVASHSLDVLLQPVTTEDCIDIWGRQKWVKKAAIILFITAVYNRTMYTYGPRGSLFPFIEAGHLMQNIYLLCPTLNLGCCAIGQFRDDAVIRLLDLDPNEEYPIYNCVLESL